MVLRVASVLIAWILASATWSAKVDAGSSLPRGLLEVPRDVAAEDRFVNENIEPRHAVAIAVTSKGSKRHQLLKDLADEEELYYLIAIGVRFAKGPSNLTVHLYREGTRVFTGKWTRSAIRSWLQHAAYPTVNRMAYQFAPAKYLTHSPFGTVLVVKPLTEQNDDLVEALRRYAAKFHARLKFTFFTKTGGTQQLCDLHGVWTNDELLLLETPQDVKTREHSNAPLAPKYRLEGVTPQRVEEFFESYAAGAWPRYYKSSSARTQSLSVSRSGIRELTGWDFKETVDNPVSSVLVCFVSANCEACEEFAKPYEEVARRVKDAQRGMGALLSHAVVARIDQSKNEHPELVRGTPWLRYWPRGRRKRPVDVELRSPDSILTFLEEQAMDEKAETSEVVPSARSGHAIQSTSTGCKAGGPEPCSPGTTRLAAPSGDAGSPLADDTAKDSRPRLQSDDAADQQDHASHSHLGKPNPEAATGYPNTAMDMEDTKSEL